MENLNIKSNITMFKLLVGIGNPGSKYNNTRHNIGWEFIDSFNTNFNFGLTKTTKDYELWKGMFKNFELYLSINTFILCTSTISVPILNI